MYNFQKNQKTKLLLKTSRLGIINPNDLLEGVGGGASGFIANIIDYLNFEKVTIFGIGKNYSTPWKYITLSEKNKFVPIANLKYPSRVPMRLQAMLYYFLNRKKILNSGVDLLYIHMPECCLPFLFFNELPVIYHQHGSGNPVALSKYLYGRSLFFKNVYELILKLIYRNADWIIAIDRICYHKAVKNGADKKTSLLMNAIDLKKYVPNNTFRLFNRQKYRINSDQHVILFVGRVELTKGVMRLLECIPHLDSKNVDFHIFIVGDGSYLQFAKNYVNNESFNSCATFLGRVDHDDLPSYYNMADVLVLPSDMEGVPMVVLESLACGTPVVASRVGGIPDIVIHGQNGYLVDDLSPENLSNTIIKILEMENDRIMISSTVQKFSSTQFVFQFNNIVKNLAGLS